MLFPHGLASETASFESPLPWFQATGLLFLFNGHAR